MKHKKGKYRIGPQRDWAKARIKGRYNLSNLCIGITGGIDRAPLPWRTVPCDVVDASAPCLTSSALSFRRLGIIYDELNRNCDERGENE